MFQKCFKSVPKVPKSVPKGSKSVPKCSKVTAAHKCSKVCYKETLRNTSLESHFGTLRRYCRYACSLHRNRGKSHSERQEGRNFTSQITKNACMINIMSFYYHGMSPGLTRTTVTCRYCPTSGTLCQRSVPKCFFVAHFGTLLCYRYFGTLPSRFGTLRVTPS